MMTSRNIAIISQRSMSDDTISVLAFIQQWKNSKNSAIPFMKKNTLAADS